MLNLEKSNNYKDKAIKLIPGLAHTFSKAPYSYVEGVYPSYIKSGSGSHLKDVDDNEYIDYVMGLGPIILGYSYSAVNNAIVDILKEGVTFSMPHYLEIEAAEMVCSVVPNAEMVKFAKTGSDAVTAAVRAARALTNRDKIAYCGGGGVWHDWFIVSTSRNAGVPKLNRELIKIFQYNNISSLQQIFDDNKGEIAAVCMEPVIYDAPEKDFLTNVKKLAHENGAILIFDEVVTGFRMSLGGAQKFFKVDPDLSCFGKAMANGMPLGAIVGRQEYMKIFGEIFYSTTYAGEIASLAACKATISTIKETNALSYIWDRGVKLKQKLEAVVKQQGLPIDIAGYPHRLRLVVKDNTGNDSVMLKSILYQECVQRGIIFGPGAILHCYSHNEKDMELTVNVFAEAGNVLKEAIDSGDPFKYLRGKPMKPVLRFPV